jgi:transposase-like protein
MTKHFPQEFRDDVVKVARLSQSSIPQVALDFGISAATLYKWLQNNVLDSKKWESQEELRIAIVHWIEGTYHRRRRTRSLGKMTPVEYEVAAEAFDKELLVA